MDNSNCFKCRKCGSSWLEFEEDGKTEHCRICGYIYDPEFPPTIGNLRDCIRCGSAVEASSESNLCDECTRDVGAAAFNKEDIEVAKRENRCVYCDSPLLFDPDKERFLCDRTECKNAYVRYLHEKKARENGFRDYNEYYRSQNSKKIKKVA